MSARPTVAVTGAAGFIGAALAGRMRARGQSVRRFVRARTGAGDDVVAIDLERTRVSELAHRLEGVDAIVHLAGRVHRHDVARDADAVYKFANVDVTERLALAAVAAGVRRFVFASTVKVNGESTLRGRPFLTGDAPAPRDAYARSKLAAERTLLQVSGGTSTMSVNLRLPLVYGPGARGNFRRLVDAVAARSFLPFGAIDNRRSLLGLDNLLDALDAVLAAPNPVVGTHFVADADGVSTPALVRAIASALRVKPRLVPVPALALRAALACSGHRAEAERLTASLEVDTSSFTRATGWQPRPFAIDARTLGPPEVRSL